MGILYFVVTDVTGDNGSGVTTGVTSDGGSGVTTGKSLIKSTQVIHQYCDWIAAGVTTIDYLKFY